MSNNKYDKEGTYYAIVNKGTKPITLDDHANFDANVFEKGTQWYNSGLSLDDAPENLKNNITFIKGFERGKRLELIEQMKLKSKGK